VQDQKADKQDSELQRIKEQVAKKDAELDAEKLVRADAEERLKRESKDKILYRLSLIGSGIFAAGLALIAFSPWKRAGLIFVSGGLLTMGSAWIFDSKWFPWVAGTTIAVALLEFSLILFVHVDAKPQGQQIGSKETNDSHK
jgi:uncharacterized membrane protein YjjP (DUF1212 family)